MNNIIEVRNLTKKFGDFAAVDKVNFTVRKGEILGFLGPNGAGKSTTIRMLTTLLRPTSGGAKIAGFDIAGHQDEVRQHIGLVAEKIILYPHLTARENIQFFGRLFQLSREDIEQRAQKWIKKLKMSDWMDTQVGTFSTGMKQRINIVRALLTEPDVLFLDEPTLGLDPQTTYLIRQFIKELNQHGVTVLLTTHDMLEADVLCDRVAIIDRGKIVALGTAQELKRQVKGKDNPTMEDVFLAITGSEVRDIKAGRVPSSAGHSHGHARSAERVR